GRAVKGYRNGGPAEVAPTNGHLGPHWPTGGRERTDRRGGGCHCETAGTGGRAAWGGHLDRPRGGSGGHNSTNLGVGIHREEGGRAVKGHRGHSCEVASTNGHLGPHW